MDRAEIKSLRIDYNQGSDKKVVLLEVEVSEPDDPQEFELQTISGLDVRPPIGAHAFSSKVSDSYDVATNVDDGIEPDESLKLGELEAYSTDGKDRFAKIRLKLDGSVVVNDGTDYAILYTEMKKAFDQLKADLDAHMAAYNTHIHTTTATVGPSLTVFGAIAPTVAVSQPSTADMTQSKVEKVRL